MVIERKQRKIIIPFRAIIKWLVRLRRSPRAIAGGFALGTFIAFTPTIGIQFAIVIFLATAMNLNRAAALIAIWITNVATMAPIYTLNFWVGTLFWPGPSVAEVYQTFLALAAQLMKLDFWALSDQFRAVMGLSTEIIIPLMIGSVMVGGVAALLVYLTALSLMRTIATKRALRRQLKN